MAAPLPLDWSRIPVFLAVAETGSLSAAAKRLGQSQPTLGRQIKAMEEELGLTLFTRQARGLVLTESGADLLEPARAMAAEANRLALAAAGREEGLAGTVRITAARMVSHHVLPPILRTIRTAEPQIQIELSASDQTENLLFREADIALRMYRPEQLEMIARHVGDMPLGIFCSASYAQRHGIPDSREELLRRDIIGFDRDDRLIRGMQAMGIEVSRTDFPLRCDDPLVAWEMMRAGNGIGFGPAILGRHQTDVVQIMPEVQLPVLPVWLTTHEVMRRTPRIRRVWDLLLTELDAALNPPP